MTSDIGNSRVFTGSPLIIETSFLTMTLAAARVSCRTVVSEGLE
jgi:hypothetical protein